MSASTLTEEHLSIHFHEGEASRETAVFAVFLGDDCFYLKRGLAALEAHKQREDIVKNVLHSITPTFAQSYLEQIH